MCEPTGPSAVKACERFRLPHIRGMLPRLFPAECSLAGAPERSLRIP